MGLRSAAHLVLLFAWACDTTPLDSVVAERVVDAGSGGDGASPAGGTSPAEAGTGAVAGGSGGSMPVEAGSGGTSGAAGAPDISECQTPGPGRYLLRDRTGERCVQKGAPDTVFGAPIFHALLDANCSTLDAEWDLLEVVPGFFALLNAGVGDNLDVRAGATTDGTPIVMYAPHPSDNQLFAFGARTAPYYALEPQNATAKCVQAIDTGAQLFPCDTSNPAQEFTLSRVDCP